MEIKNVIGKYIQEGRAWYDRVTSVEKITVHHTAARYTGGDDTILQSLMNTHVGHGWPGLSYHFIILKNGNIYQINSLDKVTWHDTHNWDSIGVCLHGYFHPEYNETPTDAQLESLEWLLKELSTNHAEFPADQDDVYGHRERSATACPGDLLFPKVVEYRTKLGDVSWGGPDSWKDYFSFDVTKRLAKEIFEGLNLHKAIDFLEETALDSIKDAWNEKVGALSDAIKLAKEWEKTYKEEVGEHGITKARLRILEDVEDQMEKVEKKNERLLEQKFQLSELIGLFIVWIKTGGDSIDEN